jgi:hypothetical protein
MQRDEAILKSTFAKHLAQNLPMDSERWLEAGLHSLQLLRGTQILKVLSQTQFLLAYNGQLALTGCRKINHLAPPS